MQQPASSSKENPYLVSSAYAPAVNFPHMRKNSMINRPTFSGSLPYIETHNSTQRRANGSYDVNNGSSPNLPNIGSNLSSSRSFYSPRHSQMKLAKIKERGIRDANQTNGSRFPSALEIKTKDGGRFINENRSFDINGKKNTSQPNLQQKKHIRKF